MISSYAHVHIVNGVTITHSHPFKNKAKGKPFHSHTQPEFQLINSVTSYNVTADVVPYYNFEVPYFWIAGSTVISDNPVYLPAVVGVLSLRAPPFIA